MADVPERPDEAAQPSAATRAMPGEEALTASASVVPEDGQWAVHLTVVFPDGVVSKRIQRYRTLRQAEVAARWIERSADRNLGGRPL